MAPLDLQGHIDRAAVRAVIERYMGAVDRSDYAAVAACFTEDADLVYCSTDPNPFRFTGGWQFAELQRTVDRFPVHTHTLSSCVVVVSGNAARAETFGFAVVGPALGEAIVRGSHFDDAFVQTAAGWRISRRTHTSTWQFRVPSAEATLGGVAIMS